MLSPGIIEWLFDGNFNDVYGQYNGYLAGNIGNESEDSDALWVSPGYTGYGSAVHFTSNIYCVVPQYLNLAAVSFTISARIWIPFNFTSEGYEYFALLSQCEQLTTDRCLHTVIANGFLHLGFYSDDLTGNTYVNSNQWYHVAYVYDQSVSEQIVYLNGNLDGSRTSTGSYEGNASQIILGPIILLTVANFQSGYIDKLIFVSRVKNATELLDEATLVAYYPFDDSYFDAGPNTIDHIVNVSTTFDSAGIINQALVIDSLNLSYFQTTGFYYLGQTNYSYSFSLWIYPFVNSGTVIQVVS